MSDNFFGDDSGFLSGLGIDVQERPEPVVEESKTESEPLEPHVQIGESQTETVAERKISNAKVIRKAKDSKKTAPESGGVSSRVKKTKKVSSGVKFTKGVAKEPTEKQLKKMESVKARGEEGVTVAEEKAPVKKDAHEIKLDKDGKPIYDKRDITPVLREARVIRKARPEDKKRNEVDDLISKKTKNYMSGLERGGSRGGNRSTGGQRGGPRRGGGGGRGRRGGLRIVPGRQTEREKAKIKLGMTNRGGNAPAAPLVKKKKTYKVSENLKKKETIVIGDTIVVKEFSEKMGVPLGELMKVLLSNKIIVAAHANIDYDTAELVAAEFEVTVVRESASVSVEDVLEANLEAILKADKDASDSVARAPVVTVMGHVDHGKTRLLDYLRKTDMVGGEAGGITQSIGASQISHNDQKITFIDTPGHELFSSIRARGSKITNIVVIVVAANDGIKPQTVEAINHAKDAGAPIIVAITKMDLGMNKFDEIKGQLSENGLVPEEWGGETIIVPCSAVTGQGIDDLLDMILLQTEMLELTYSPSRSAVGVVVEAHKDAQIGVQTSMLLMTGTLRVGDVIVIHNTYGRVRRMLDWNGKQITEAHGGEPVMILGVNDVPEPGRVAEVVANDKEANKKISLIKEHDAKAGNDGVLQTVMDKISEGDTVHLKLILKADSYGSLEAIKQTCAKIEMPENIQVKIVHSDVGAITNSDLVFAKAAEALVIGYNVPIPGLIRKKAEQQKITVKQFDIIYEFIEYVEDISKGLIEIEKVETLIGKMKVLALFFRKGKDMIVGGKIIEGRTENRTTFKVMRGTGDDEEQIANGKVTSLQREQESVKVVNEGYECGIRVRATKKIFEDDIIEFYKMEPKE